MAVLNSGVTIAPGPAAGVGAAVGLPAVSADGLSGLAGVTTGASGLGPGALATIHLAQPVTADMDAYAQTTGGPNAGAFACAGVMVTAFPPAPPAGVMLFPLAQLANGQIPGFGVGVTGALLPSTTYRFSWRVLT